MENSAADEWDGTLAAALIGAERGRPSAGGLTDLLSSSGDPGGDLLGRLGAAGLYRLAGRTLAQGSTTAFEPFSPVGPECPPASTTRLAGLLGDGERNLGLIQEWCELAAQAGVRAPLELVVILADKLTSESSRAILSKVAGDETAWIGRLWGDAPEQEGAGLVDPGSWNTLEGKARFAAFKAFRAQNPGAARTSLKAVFKNEKADAREQFLGLLAEGLGMDDEPFLEAGLDDRATGVKLAARRLLRQLPESRYKQRLGARARSALTIAGSGEDALLTVSLPDESPELARDGIETYASVPGGPKARLLREILESAPLDVLDSHPPDLWIDLALKSDWAELLISAFAQSASFKRNPTWSWTLLARLDDVCAGRAGVQPSDPYRQALVRVVSGLPPDAWNAFVMRLMERKAHDLVPLVLRGSGGDYSETMTLRILGWMEEILPSILRGTDRRDAQQLNLPLGSRGYPSVSHAEKLAAIGTGLPDTYQWVSRNLTAMADMLSVRAAMRQEFATP